MSLFPYLKKWNNDSDNRTIMRPDAKYSINVSCYLLLKLLLLFPVLTIFILAWKAGCWPQRPAWGADTSKKWTFPPQVLPWSKLVLHLLSWTLHGQLCHWDSTAREWMAIRLIWSINFPLRHFHGLSGKSDQDRWFSESTYFGSQQVCVWMTMRYCTRYFTTGTLWQTLLFGQSSVYFHPVSHCNGWKAKYSLS